MHRRAQTILTVVALASVAAGCSSLDTDTVARVDGTEFTQDELDELLDAQQAGGNADAARAEISNWIFETTVEKGLVTEELLAGLPDDQLVPSYDDGIALSGVMCPTIMVAASAEAGDAAVEQLAAGTDVLDVLAEFNIDPQLGDTGGRAGCFPAEQFDPATSDTPEVQALFSVNADDPYATAPTPGPDGTTAALVIGFRPFEDLDPTEAEQVLQALRQTVGLRVLVEDIDIDVDSRYGTFDVDRGGVVALG
ncbi:MAG: hypothetical protein ABJ382_06860 [Ilumatobacter sp.]